MTEIRAHMRDGKEEVQVKCPECGTWADADDDQVSGEVSLICPNCGAHFLVDDDDIKIELRGE